MKKETIGIILAVILAPFGFYFIIGAIAWFVSDPFDIIPNGEVCEYTLPGKFSCVTKEEYCRNQTRMMFWDLNDTVGSNTNNQDQMSKAMVEIYDKCVETE